MKKLLLLLLPLVISQHALCQINIQWSKPIVTEQGKLFTDLIGEIDGNLYIIESNSESYYLSTPLSTSNTIYGLPMEGTSIVAVKDNLSRGNAIAVPGHDEYKKAVLEKITITNKKIYILFQYFNKSEKKTQLLVSALDKNLSVIHAPKVVLEFEKKGGVSEYKFDFSTSPDGQSFLISGDLIPDLSKRGEHIYTFSVLDPDLNVKKEASYKDAKLNWAVVSDQIIDNKGDAYFVLHQGSNNPNFRKGGMQYKHKAFMLLFNRSVTTPDILQIDLKEKYPFPHSLLYIKNENTLYCTGYFHNDGIKDFAVGSYVAAIDIPKQAISNVSMHEIPQEEYKKIFGNNDHISPHAVIKSKQIVNDENGGISIIGEYDFSLPNDPGSPIPSFSTDHILVSRATREGNIKRIDIIVKEQSGLGKDRIYYSYAVLPAQGKLFFIFNDSPDNAAKNPLNGNNLKPAMTPANESLVLVTLSQDGSLSRSYEKSNKTIGLIPSPMYNTVVQNKVYFVAIKDKAYQIGVFSTSQ